MMHHQPNLLTDTQNQEYQAAAAWLAAQASAGELSSDARKLAQGDVFVAYAFDAQHDGRAYVEQAHEQGAAAVLWQNDGIEMPVCHVANYAVPELNILAGHIASTHYGQPSANMNMVAVTGTNGKTSCAQWLAQLLDASEQKCALIGTLGAGFVDAMVETGFTTPQAVEVHRLLRDLKNQNARAVVMEVSSHALVQGRVNGVNFDVALFTNLSRDHLDYHGDMAAYEAAKTQLFMWHGLKTAVINLDDEVGLRLAAVAKQNGVRVIGYGTSKSAVAVDAYLQATEVAVVGAQTVIQLHVDGRVLTVASGLVGQFNVMNLLGVLGVMHALGHDLSVLVPLCQNILAAPGRMQRFGAAHQPLVVVDFAHTPDALEKTLHALAPIAASRAGRLICVFGCGGDRDAGKRPQMGHLASTLSDVVYVTSDNPRSESPESIVAQIVEGATGSAQVVVEVNRKAATEQAILMANKNDVILIAGKGHEAHQEIKGIKHPYSDLTEVNNALTRWTTT